MFSQRGSSAARAACSRHLVRLCANSEAPLAHGLLLAMPSGGGFSAKRGKNWNPSTSGMDIALIGIVSIVSWKPQTYWVYNWQRLFIMEPNGLKGLTLGPTVTKRAWNPQYMGQFRQLRIPPILGIGYLIDELERANAQAWISIEGCQQEHAMKWQTKDGVYQRNSNICFRMSGIARLGYYGALECIDLHNPGIKREWILSSGLLTKSLWRGCFTRHAFHSG